MLKANSLVINETVALITALFGYNETLHKVLVIFVLDTQTTKISVDTYSCNVFALPFV